jgi:hypothetical protein
MNLRTSLLFHPDPAASETGSGNSSTAPIPAQPVPEASPGRASVPNPPPAATVVQHGSKTERELELEEKLSKTDADRKKEQTRLAELEDENRRLKSPPSTALPKDRWQTLLEGE